jgi:hypothetical protein
MSMQYYLSERRGSALILGEKGDGGAKAIAAAKLCWLGFTSPIGKRATFFPFT